MGAELESDRLDGGRLPPCDVFLGGASFIEVGVGQSRSRRGGRRADGGRMMNPGMKREEPGTRAVAHLIRKGTKQNHPCQRRSWKVRHSAFVLGKSAGAVTAERAANKECTCASSKGP
jgi:hypothetical protein